MLRPIFGALLLLAAVGATALAQQQRPHHTGAGIDCAMCHGAGASQYQPVGTATCVTCHNRAALIKRTERLNRTVKEKNPVTGLIETVTKDINPHSGHHDRGRLDCFECHREHKPSINLCSQCHDVARWMGRVP